MVEMENSAYLPLVLMLNVSMQGQKADFHCRVLTTFTIIHMFHRIYAFNELISRNATTILFVSRTYWGVNSKRKKVLSYFFHQTTLKRCLYNHAMNHDQHMFPSFCAPMLRVCNFQWVDAIINIQNLHSGYVSGPSNVGNLIRTLNNNR